MANQFNFFLKKVLNSVHNLEENEKKEYENWRFPSVRMESHKTHEEKLQGLFPSNWDFFFQVASVLKYNG